MANHSSCKKKPHILKHLLQCRRNKLKCGEIHSQTIMCSLVKFSEVLRSDVTNYIPPLYNDSVNRSLLKHMAPFSMNEDISARHQLVGMCSDINNIRTSSGHQDIQTSEGLYTEPFWNDLFGRAGVQQTPYSFLGGFGVNLFLTVNNCIPVLHKEATIPAHL